MCVRAQEWNKVCCRESNINAIQLESTWKFHVNYDCDRGGGGGKPFEPLLLPCLSVCDLLAKILL